MDSKRRSLAKAISWRVVATVITTLVALLITGEVTAAFEIGLLDTTIKFLAYYGHERVWNLVNFGRHRPRPDYRI